MSLRLKMNVESVRRVADSAGEISAEEIQLRAVYSDTGVNKQWSKWTPNGSLQFTVTNPTAFEKLLPGQLVFVDISSAGKDE